MTAATPAHPGTTRTLCSSSARTRGRQALHDLRLPSMSILLGALSITTFWVLGLGFVLGTSAVLCGALATARSDDDEAASLRALLGILAGAAGITLSAIALLPALDLRT